MTRKHNHYYRAFPFRNIDVYRLLHVYGVTDPCVQHAIKKLLALGKRGAKDDARDVQDCIDTLQRWQEMRAEEAEVALADRRADPDFIDGPGGVFAAPGLRGTRPTIAVVDEHHAADTLAGYESLNAFRTDGAFRFGGRDLEVVTAPDQDPATVTIAAPPGLIVGTGAGTPPAGLIVALDPGAPEGDRTAPVKMTGRGWCACVTPDADDPNFVDARQIDSASGSGALVDAKFRAVGLPLRPGVYLRLYVTDTPNGRHAREFFCWWNGGAWSAGRTDFYSAQAYKLASAAGEVVRPWRGEPGTDLPFAKDPAP